MKKNRIIKVIVLTLALAAAAHNSASAQSSGEYGHVFRHAASRYDIPVEILLAVGYAQTRLMHVAEPNAHNCHSHKPPAYGIMGLHNDSWFGRQLVIASKLIGSSAEKTASSPEENILGAAAYLSSLANELKINRHDLNAWKPVLEKYSGIPQKQIREFFSYDVLSAVHRGFEINGYTLDARAEVMLSVFPPLVRGTGKIGVIESDDYPAAVWDPSPNYTTGSISQQFAVVHTTEGNFSGALSWLKNTAAQASAHYIIRSSDGYIVQLVRESNRAWHARCWNGNMLGVEHEAFVAQQSYYTDAMYIASAALFRHFAQKFSIPMTRNRIIGHNEWQSTTWKSWMAANFPSIDVTCNTHTDPGQYWDWDFYMQLVTQDTAKPAVTANVPANGDTVWRGAPLKFTFNQKMKKTETQSAFSISPSATGTFTWENNQRTLVFTPTTPLAAGTNYAATISTAAKNYLALSPQSAKTVNFRSASSLAVSSVYPLNNAAAVHALPEIKITFNVPLKQSSIAANITLKTADGAAVASGTIQYSVVNGAGVVMFAPLAPLSDSKQYTVTVKSSLLDSSGIALGTDNAFSFTTGRNSYIGGAVFDSVESAGGWKDPNYSGSTVGTDTSSSFAVTNEKKKTGTYSGRIKYLFTGNSGGVCRTFTSTKPNQGALQPSRTGFWIYGDLSNNYLEYWFYYNSTSNSIVRVDTLNWQGWKYVEAPLIKINQAGDKLFHSIVIIQNASGSKSGTIYFDDGQRSEQTRLDIACRVEGLFDPGTGKMRPDTITVSLRSAVAPFAALEAKKTVLDSTGSAAVLFNIPVIGNDYYISLNHRNSIETWIKSAQRTAIPVLTMDFASAETGAYGDNLKLVGGKYCVYSGDINQDGIIDFSDLSLVDNASLQFLSGYVPADIDGDGFVDFSDVVIVDNNSLNFVISLRP